VSRRRNKSVDLTETQFKELVNKVSQKTQPIKPKSITFKTANQKHYFETILENQITIATGVAGTAKTFLACYTGLKLLCDGEIDRIIITKPAVVVGKTQGFLPGNIDEKMEPFTASVMNCIVELVGEAQANTLRYSKKQIEVVPLQYLRGLTLDNCYIIADEMQNADYTELKALLTRLGENSVLVINGDVEQTDLKDSSGLPAAIEILDGIEGVGFVEFTIDDIVRSGIVKDIIINYYKYEKKHKVSE
jgi:phosphate starvation-inducible PhoH-like protein